MQAPPAQINLKKIVQQVAAQRPGSVIPFPTTKTRNPSGKISVLMSDTFRITKYWMKHDSAWDRRHLNKEFRLKEKQYFHRFGEFLRKCKSRGWKTW